MLTSASICPLAPQIVPDTSGIQRIFIEMKDQKFNREECTNAYPLLVNEKALESIHTENGRSLIIDLSGITILLYYKKGKSTNIF